MAKQDLPRGQADTNPDAETTRVRIDTARAYLNPVLKDTRGINEDSLTFDPDEVNRTVQLQRQRAEVAEQEAKLLHQQADLLEQEAARVELQQLSNNPAHARAFAATARAAALQSQEFARSVGAMTDNQEQQLETSLKDGEVKHQMAQDRQDRVLDKAISLQQEEVAKQQATLDQQQAIVHNEYGDKLVTKEHPYEPQPSLPPVAVAVNDVGSIGAGREAGKDSAEPKSRSKTGK